MLLEVLKILARFILPILIIIFILTIIDILLNYKKYGTRIFSSFKKYNLNGTMKDIVIDMLKKQNHRDILIVNRDDNSFYALTNYDVFAIYVFDNNYSLFGDINDEYLKSNDEKILNPIPKFLNDNNKIMSKEINLKNVYINTKKDVKLNISNLEGRACTLKEFCYGLYSNQHSNIKYSKEEIINLKKIIEDIIYGNNED